MRRSRKKRLRRYRMMEARGFAYVTPHYAERLERVGCVVTLNPWDYKYSFVPADLLVMVCRMDRDHKSGANNHRLRRVLVHAQSCPQLIPAFEAAQRLGGYEAVDAYLAELESPT